MLLDVARCYCYYRPNFEFLAKYLIHSLDSGDFSVSAKKKINAKKLNNYGIRQHILEEMYADLKEIPGIHKALCMCNVL